MNVWDLAQRRLETLFGDFDNVYVSFSGGKDSGVMLFAVLEFMERNGIDRKLPVMHMDYEAQYQQTTDFVDLVFERYADRIEPYRICLPFRAQCACSMTSDYWVPWDPGAQDVWVRDMPANAINLDNHEFGFWKEGMQDYDVQTRFANWLHERKAAKKTAALVGIRTQESLHRWCAIFGARTGNRHDGLEWTHQVKKNIINAYPIHDWATEDIWTANAKNGWPYNALYDLFHTAGVPLHSMRVASPFNDAAPASLKLYKAIDPNTWAKMVGRTNGVNFTALYGTTTAMGWQSIVLPEGHTWESYMWFLLDTVEPHVKETYVRKLQTSIEYWRTDGGHLTDETIAELQSKGIELDVGGQRRGVTDKVQVRMEYHDDINAKDFRLLPTYKRMCIAIMKNDISCKTLGFGATKKELERRKHALELVKSL